jgi:putative transcriptional regulator
VESVSGKLLIAAPSLGDWFHRSVLLVVEHADEGAFGIVLNRPSETTVAEAAPELAPLGGEGIVHVGGPVAPQAAVALAEFEDPDQAQRIVVGDVGLVDLEREDNDVRRVRVYAGYAGWSAGQLDTELEQEGWIVGDMRPEDPFTDGDLWAIALRRMGPEFALVARMPADPSMN